MAAGSSWASSFSTLLGTGGLMLGVVLCAFAFLTAKRGVTMPVALSMIAVALLIAVAAVAAVIVGMIGAFDEVTRLGPAVTPADLSGGILASLIHGGLGGLGFVLALAGALRALASARAADSDDVVVGADRGVSQGNCRVS